MTLESMLKKRQYKGMNAEEALNKAYELIDERIKRGPRSEEELIFGFLHEPEIRTIFSFYFAIHPEEAAEIVAEHESKYAGIRRLIKPIAELFFDNLYIARYRTAKEYLEAMKIS